MASASGGLARRAGASTLDRAVHSRPADGEQPGQFERGVLATSPELDENPPEPRVVRFCAAASSSVDGRLAGRAVVRGRQVCIALTRRSLAPALPADVTQMSTPFVDPFQRFVVTRAATRGNFRRTVSGCWFLVGSRARC